MTKAFCSCITNKNYDKKRLKKYLHSLYNWIMKIWQYFKYNFTNLTESINDNRMNDKEWYGDILLFDCCYEK